MAAKIKCRKLQSMHHMLCLLTCMFTFRTCLAMAAWLLRRLLMSSGWLSVTALFGTPLLLWDGPYQVCVPGGEVSS